MIPRATRSALLNRGDTTVVQRSKTSSVDLLERFASEERIALHVECSRVSFATSASKRLDSVTDLHIDKSRVLEQRFPACTRQATGDSTSPQVDFPAHLLRHVDAVGNVRELQDASRPQYPPNLL